MSNRPCKSAILCDLFPGETDPPTGNFSSEAPDPLVFISRYFPPNPRPCLGCDPTTVYHSVGCNGTVFSAASQDEADLLARLSATVCKEPASQQYTNNPQTATVQCPGGSLFSYTVPGGYMTTSTDPDPDAWIAAADAAALAYAQQQASSREQSCCAATTSLLPHPGWMCLGETLLDSAINRYTITGLNSQGVWQFSLLSGSLPDGVSLVTINNNTVEIQGTPTTPGSFTYSILAYRPALPYITVTMTDTLRVIGITNPDLPNGTVGTAYSEQLASAGGIAPTTFSGTPPAGLTLHADGTIDGTPTTATSTPFDVTITDAEGRTCVQPVTVTVTGTVTDLGYYLCGWPLIMQAFHDAGLPACGPDNRPYWQGYLNLKATYNSPNNYPFYYFIGNSLFAGWYGPTGIAISADQDPLYPSGDWQNLGVFTELYWYFNGSTYQWSLSITDICGNYIWYGDGSTNINDASGEYVRAGGNSAIPLYIYVSKVTNAGNLPLNCITSCAGFTDVDWLCNPGTCRLRIAGYVDSYSICLWYGVADTGVIWDGTFPEFSGGNIGAYDAGGVKDATIGGSQQLIGTPFLNYDPTNNLWVLGIGDAPQGFLWAGTHAGPDPIGVYTQDLAITQCGGPPASFTIEAYTP